MKVVALVCLALVGYTAAYQLCKSTNQPDVLLVVEDSQYLPQPAIPQLQGFLAEIVNYFELDPASAQVAYHQYSEAGDTNVFRLNTYSKTNDARSKILTTSFTATGSAPVIASGLNYSWTDQLTVTNGERSCHPTVVILVSYSSYADPNGVGAPDQSLIAEDLTAVRRLKDSGALVITVGIGPNRNPQHLLELASPSATKSNYHDFADFSVLNNIAADDIAADACAYVTDGAFYPCEMEVVKADFVFIVDVSNPNFTPDLASNITTFIQNTLTPYTYDHKIGVQAALITYQKDADIQINLGDTDTLEQFISSVQAALGKSCDVTDRCIDDALDKTLHKVLVDSAGYRSNCTAHFVYVFTSNCFNCPADPIPNANSIRALPNTQIFVVPLVQTFGFWKEYLEIGDDASHLLEVQPNPQAILTQYLHKQTWRSVCQAYDVARCPLEPRRTTFIPPTEYVNLTTSEYLNLTTSETPGFEPRPTVRRGPHQMRPGLFAN